MATNNSSNQKFTNNADGFDLAGGTTARKITISGGDISMVGSGAAVISFPASTSTLATLALSETLTNKILTSPILTTPTLGVASATTINKVTITAPATGSTLTIADGKTLTVNNSLTFAGTDATTITFQGTDTYVGRATTDTLTNKTLTTPTITKPVMSATNPTAQTYTPAAAGTATLDLSLSNQHFITMPAGNITIALSNDTNNQPFLIAITQDATGSRTVTWPATIRWAGGSVPVLTTTASKRDTFGFIRTGAATYDGFIVGQNI